MNYVDCGWELLFQ